MRRLWFLSVVVVSCLAVGALAGCSGGKKKEANEPDTGTPGVTQTNPPDEALTQQIKRAVLDKAAVTAEGLDVAVEPDWVELDATLPRCPTRLAADASLAYAYEQSWDNETGYVQQTVIGYRNTTAAAVVGQIRTRPDSCRKYEYEGDVYETGEELTFPQVAGLDGQVGYCEKIAGADQTIWICVAYLARGGIVSRLDVSAANADAAASRNLLTKLAPKAGAALAKA